MGSEAALVSRIQAGDREALGALYERYFPTIWRYVHSQLRGQEGPSHDVVAETFLAAIQGIGRLDGASTNVAAWLTGVARHKIADYWRQSARQVLARDVGPAERESNPATAMGVADIRRMVGQAMDRLDDMERVALEWKYIDALPVREIARRLGRTEKSVEAILYRARNAFRAQYDRIAHDPSEEVL